MALRLVDRKPPRALLGAFSLDLRWFFLVPFQRDASRSNGMPPYGMSPHAKALERDAPNGSGDPAGRHYEAAMVAIVRNGEVAINSWNGTSSAYKGGPQALSYLF